MSSKIRIVVAEDHDFFRKGVISSINELNFTEVIGEASNGIELLKVINTIQPDIILLDIKMPKMNGVIVAEKILSIYPKIKIIMLTLYGEEGYLKKMIELGVSGFLLKNTNKEGLERAIKSVMDGNQYFSEELIPFLTKKYIEKPTTSKNSESLTNRELEILQLIVDGLTTKEIAKKLFLSDKTIINHRTNLLSKTSSKNTASLITYALKNQLVTLK